LGEVLHLEPEVFSDDRGSFTVIYNRDELRKVGLEAEFVQDNQSRSYRNVVRGLHFQEPNPQGKLVRCVRGELFDVAVDIRLGSPYFGQWAGYKLTEDNRQMLWIPPGFAHGFCALSEIADLAYKCTTYRDEKSEQTIAWDDPDIDIRWPLDLGKPYLSARDAAARRLKDANDVLPQYK
jgi:dTDP-4-dehydrorhamnose 3,5-epimerase